MQLCESLSDVCNDFQKTWLVSGDFNVITTKKETLWGLPMTEDEFRDFNHCVNVFSLINMRFKGSKFTWWNRRIDKASIFKRLDRFMCNQLIPAKFPIVEVEYLLRIGSDHALILITLNNETKEVIKYFTFLNFWLKEESFMEIVKYNWHDDFEGNLFFVYHFKIKKLIKVI